MWTTRAEAACGGALLAAALVLAGCQKSGGSDAPSERPSLTGAPGGHGAVFLGIDDCASRGRERVTEVPCGSERAAARVIARHDGPVGDGPLCPARTDYVLHISERRPAVDEDGDGEVSRGYACMRNLEPPHPGDPGGGGGPRTVVGDCVYGAGRGEVRETPCDGSGRRAPEYRVVAAVATRPSCAPGTALYVSLGGTRPVGCAVRV
ncbi:hypothetical protein [Streptomyces sp. AN091965]|uniref:hypothetical protein n=1 Tax=Streptomyces sp. AN091965 TaxID=2927803 RepID=UPI001F62179B|nr:hypothetical protein [Streptomyces sp. AN091965]MCI3930811.1 hypothetical protein [Streptomyces sp. AN091965]